MPTYTLAATIALGARSATQAEIRKAARELRTPVETRRVASSRGDVAGAVGLDLTAAQAIRARLAEFGIVTELLQEA